MTIVYLSGVEDKQPNLTESSKRIKNDLDEAADKATATGSVTFYQKDIEALENNFEKRKKSETDCVDILLTNQWPKYVEKDSNQQLVSTRNFEFFVLN